MGLDAAALSAAARQSERLKNDGNEYYRKGRIGAAIDAYTGAITLCPNVAVYWTNRALCHQRRKYLRFLIFFCLFFGFLGEDFQRIGKRNVVSLYGVCRDWGKVEEDCRKALQLDHDSVKGHYMLGLALLQKEEYSEGVKELERAMDLGRGAHPSSYMVEEIWHELAKAKYLEWEHNSTKRSWELQSLKETCELALEGKFSLDDSQAEGFLDDKAHCHSENLEALGRVFQKAGKADIPTEVPDYLCCKITLDIFRDPVITPSGLTYERAMILEHLSQVGRFDPATREPLSASQLVPNLAIKAAVQAYLDEHGWAYNMF